MRELEHRQKLKKRMYSLPVLGILLLVTIAIGRGAYALLVKERDSARDARLLAEKVQTLTLREKQLTDEIAKLNTEAGIEEEIKSKFNVARAGEHVAVIVDKPASTASTTPEKAPWWKRLYYLFGDAIIGE